MKEIEISFLAEDSNDVYRVTSSVEIESYEKKEDGSEAVYYNLYDIEIEREDGSIIEVEEDELEYFISKKDQMLVEQTILEEIGS